MLLVKGKLLRRWEAERKVAAPLDAFEPFQVAAGCVVALVLTVWSVSSLTAYFF